MHVTKNKKNDQEKGIQITYMDFSFQDLIAEKIWKDHI